MALYAVQAVGEVRQVATAGDVLARLAESAEALLRAW